MFRKLTASSGNLVGFRVSGKLTDRDFKDFIPQVERIIDENGCIRLLFELDDFHGWDLQAAWDDVKFSLKHLRDIERLAVVGDREWEQWMVRLAKPFALAKVKYYDKHQLHEAWEWLREGAGETGARKGRTGARRGEKTRP
jgi:hypothetical protein